MKPRKQKSHVTQGNQSQRALHQGSPQVMSQNEPLQRGCTPDQQALDRSGKAPAIHSESAGYARYHDDGTAYNPDNWQPQDQRVL